MTEARAAGHEVLLQIPLEPNNYPTEDPGPHTLLTTLPPDENLKRLQWLMSRYTGYVGITNHMGAKFETTREAMAPVLEEVKRRGLLYLDDGSVKGSAGETIAGAIGLDYAVANVRLDEGSGRARQGACRARDPGARARHGDRRREGQGRHREAARGLGRPARGQGSRAGAGQRRHALAAAKLTILP